MPRKNAAKKIVMDLLKRAELQSVDKRERRVDTGFFSKTTGLTAREAEELVVAVANYCNGPMSNAMSELRELRKKTKRIHALSK